MWLFHFQYCASVINKHFVSNFSLLYSIEVLFKIDKLCGKWYFTFSTTIQYTFPHVQLQKAWIQACILACKLMYISSGHPEWYILRKWGFFDVTFDNNGTLTVLASIYNTFWLRDSRRREHYGRSRIGFTSIRKWSHFCKTKWHYSYCMCRGICTWGPRVGGEKTVLLSYEDDPLIVCDNSFCVGTACTSHCLLPSPRAAGDLMCDYSYIIIILLATPLWPSLVVSKSTSWSVGR